MSSDIHFIGTVEIDEETGKCYVQTPEGKISMKEAQDRWCKKAGIEEEHPNYGVAETGV